MDVLRDTAPAWGVESEPSLLSEGIAPGYYLLPSKIEWEGDGWRVTVALVEMPAWHTVWSLTADADAYGVREAVEAVCKLFRELVPIPIDGV